MRSNALFPIDSNGQINIRREGLNQSGDIYHTLMKMSWKQFFLFFSVGYFIINSVFAFLYYLGGDIILNAEANSYWDAFVFSFQTSSTIGYGHFIPKTNYAHFIVMLDTISGILFVAIATGIAFGKFSRPTARVLFSKNIITGKMNGQEMMSFRMGNARSNQIVDANVTVVMTKPEMTLEGQSIRRIYDLKLERKNSPLFSLSWLVMHKIDKDSPLFHMTEEELRSEEVVFIVSLTGVDDVFSQMIYDRHLYHGNNVCIDKKFVDVMRIDEKGLSYVDYTKFHDLY